MIVCKHVGGTFIGCWAVLAVLYAATNPDSTAAEPSGAAEPSSAKSETPAHYFPENAFEYAKMVEPILGVPPKIDLGDAVEIPIYVDGGQAHGYFDYGECDNPSRLGKGGISGSVVQRYEGRTRDGEPLPDVIWAAFGRNASYTVNGKLTIFGSVQFIGYHKKTGATAFFESSDAIDPWAEMDSEGERLVGKMPWIDDPEQFNQAFRTPRTIQCVECHQNDPFIHNSFIDAAKIPGTDETVIPTLEGDSPYYVIGGQNWDMRTIHIADNGCFECHRVGMSTLKLFTRYHWEPNEVMPPHDPGSLKEDLEELLVAWEQGPENTPGAEWVIPPARGEARKVVGDDYPYKSSFNQPGGEAMAFEPKSKSEVRKDEDENLDAATLAARKKFNQAQNKSLGTSGKRKSSKNKSADGGGLDMSEEELVEAMKAKGMTDEEISKWLVELKKKQG